MVPVVELLMLQEEVSLQIGDLLLGCTTGHFFGCSQTPSRELMFCWWDAETEGRSGGKMLGKGEEIEE